MKLYLFKVISLKVIHLFTVEESREMWWDNVAGGSLFLFYSPAPLEARFFLCAFFQRVWTLLIVLLTRPWFKVMFVLKPVRLAFSSCCYCYTFVHATYCWIFTWNDILFNISDTVFVGYQLYRLLWWWARKLYLIKLILTGYFGTENNFGKYFYFWLAKTKYSFFHLNFRDQIDIIKHPSKMMKDGHLWWQQK